MNTYRTRSPQDTIGLGTSFAARLVPGDVVTLTGNLGSGKTQFVVGVCKGLRAVGHVSSPTFTLINEYDAPFGKVVHIDLYRIATPAELAGLGIEEYFDPMYICLIEWPEMLAGRLPARYFDVRLEFGAGADERRITIREVVSA